MKKVPTGFSGEPPSGPAIPVTEYGYIGLAGLSRALGHFCGAFGVILPRGCG